MEKDLLNDIITKIEKWCKDNEISVFYGSINESDNNIATEVTWTNNSNADWEKYLETIKRTDAKIVILNIDLNNIDTEDDETINYYNSSC